MPQNRKHFQIVLACDSFAINPMQNYLRMSREKGVGGEYQY